MTPNPELLRLLSVVEDATLSDAQSGIEQLRNLYAAWLGWSTRVVVLGLLCELPEIVKDIKDALLYVKRGFIPSDFRGNPPLWRSDPGIKALAAIGWVLIVLGVIGEWYFESLVSIEDTSIQQIADERTGRLDQEVVDAHARAGEAYESAQVAYDSATRAYRESAAAQKDAGAASKQALNAFREVLATEMALIQQGPRSTLLSGFRRTQVIRQLLSCRGQRFTVRRCASRDDTEATYFAGVLSFTLVDAKWNNNLSPSAFVDPGNCSSEGVTVSVKPTSAQSIDNCGKELASALTGDWITGVRFNDHGQFDIIPRGGPPVPYDSETVLVDVYTHPLARFPETMPIHKPK